MRSLVVRGFGSALLLGSLSSLGCGDDGTSDSVVFPEDYASTYTEVRNCRANGGSHDFNRIRVLTDESGLVAYRDRTEPFPEGAIVLKEEYDSNDMDCSGAIKQWAVMQKLPAGNEELLNWRWQQVDFARNVINEDEPRCFGCHAGCPPPDGYDGTCTVP